MELVSLLRIKHWVKNLFIFIPILVSGSLLDIASLEKATIAFVFFCTASSLVYIINDLKDVEKDRNHPVKKNRPLASGRIKKSQAYLIVGVLLVIISIGQFLFSPATLYIISAYVILNLVYTFWTKNIPILDVISISSGFVLRVQTGVVATSLIFSSWLVIMTFTLAMLLGLGKRKAELISLDGNVDTRKSLKGYSLQFISSLQTVFSTITITVYILYTVFSETFPGNRSMLLYSSVFVIAGLSRYIQISNSEDMIEEPTNILYKDKFVFATVFLWVLYIGISIYVL